MHVTKNVVMDKLLAAVQFMISNGAKYNVIHFWNWPIFNSKIYFDFYFINCFKVSSFICLLFRDNFEFDFA